MAFTIFFTFLVIFIDQLVKLWVVNNMDLHSSLPLIDGIIDLYYIHNDGAGWGILSGQMTLFILLTIVFIIYILYRAYKNRHEASYVHFIYGLLLGGALGNLIDRLRFGYVIDMFRFLFVDFPIFNIADAALSIGVVLLILLIIFRKDADHIL